ncbi:mechanosensitive ion channel family protein [Oscillatoria sp. FACHB-1407]|uniref:mechanosensitive ion channel family protein n=1 Tax=Oscillatoria sp. FACHB-1407 TaxID=2692847 RepID=UPI00168220AC|nr:mechanosensitive ion channel family protein [Oscillatoria sp. FACHB-1407]MBD2459731.1 mechanosensitive ion channel family protein [Oscillatoria sp. FACHB-1407]
MGIRRTKRQRNSTWLTKGAILATSAVLLVLMAAPLSWGQAPNLPSVQPSPSSSIRFNIPAFASFLNSGDAVARDVVRLDGYRLFSIAAPVVDAPSAAGTVDPLTLRVKVIQDKLQQIVTSNFEVDSLEVYFEVDPDSRQPIIYANYRAGDETVTEQIMTVTSLDAQIHATDLETWAEELTDIIEGALLRAKQERQPAFLRQQVPWGIGIFVAMVLASVVVTAMQRMLQRERRWLSAQAKVESQQMSQASDEAIAGDTSSGVSMTTLLQRQLKNRQRKGVNDIQRRLLQLLQMLIWGGGVLLILGLFPYSRWLQTALLVAMQVPAKMLAIAFITYLAVRLMEVLIDRFFGVLQNSVSFAPETSQRVALRFSTFSRVIKGVVAFILVGSGAIAILSLVGVQVGPLLAGAGIIGLGISFASQSLIKDIINGFFILLEDQYGVGDVITVGTVSGLVENMNLRITQLRNEEGQLITIPNSAITIVQNLSKEWSRVALRVDVAYTADIDKALAVVDQVAQDMSNAPYWRELILEKPLVLGIDKLDYMGTTISLWIKTQPLKQWEVAREYRRRLKLAFDRAGIAIGVPQQSLWFGNSLDIEEEPSIIDKINQANKRE